MTAPVKAPTNAHVKHFMALVGRLNQDSPDCYRCRRTGKGAQCSSPRLRANCWPCWNKKRQMVQVPA